MIAVPLTGYNVNRVFSKPISRHRFINSFISTNSIGWRGCAPDPEDQDVPSDPYKHKGLHICGTWCPKPSQLSTRHWMLHVTQWSNW